MVKYRPHRGGLAESLKEAREFESIDEMKRYILGNLKKILGDEISLDQITIDDSKSINDDRIGWRNVRYVKVTFQDCTYVDGMVGE